MPPMTLPVRRELEAESRLLHGAHRYAAECRGAKASDLSLLQVCGYGYGGRHSFTVVGKLQCKTKVINVWGNLYGYGLNNCNYPGSTGNSTGEWY